MVTKDRPEKQPENGSGKFLRQIRLTDLSEADARIIGDMVNQEVNKLGEFKRTWKQKQR